MKPVNVNAFDVRSYVAGARTPFGAVCHWSEDGIVKPAHTGTEYSYVGVAIEDAVEKTVDGFYSQYDPTPLVTAGVARVWLLGGDTVDAGDYVKIAAALGAGSEFLGVVDAESSETKTLYSIGRVLGADAGDANYDQTIDSIAAKVLTFASSTVMGHLDLAKGDYIVIDSGEAAEVNRIDDPAVSTLTCSVQLDPDASHSSAIMAYKLVQTEVLLI